MLHSEPWPECYQKPFLQRKHRPYGLHLLLVTHTLGPEKNLTSPTTASCSSGCTVILPPTSEGGVREENPPHPTNPWVMSSEPSLRRLPGPHTRNRLTNYSQIKLIQAHLAHPWGRQMAVLRESTG